MATWHDLSSGQMVPSERNCSRASLSSSGDAAMPLKSMDMQSFFICAVCTCLVAAGLRRINNSGNALAAHSVAVGGMGAAYDSTS
jgi:hypothetical protein